MRTGKYCAARLVLPVCLGILAWSAPVFAQESEVITQQIALQRALLNHPRLHALEADREAAAGRILQASLRPNPAIEAELDQKILTESSDSRSEMVPEGSLAISQILERGDKRNLRMLKAKAGASLLDFVEARQRLEIAAGVRREFTILCGAREKNTLRQEAYDLAVGLTGVINERVAAGAISPIEETRARVALTIAGKSLEAARREVAEARQALAGAMGLPEADFDNVTCQLDEGPDIPNLDTLKERLASNPDLALRESERKELAAALRVEQSLSYQDITVKAGIRRNQEDQETFFFAGISMPFPFYDRNQGKIREAAAGISKAEIERRQVENSIRNDLVRRHGVLVSSAREAKMLKEDAIVSATQAYEAVNEGYRFGKFRYLDVLDAGNALIETKLSYLEALLNLHLARVEVDRLVGEPATALFQAVKRGDT